MDIYTATSSGFRIWLMYQDDHLFSSIIKDFDLFATTASLLIRQDRRLKTGGMDNLLSFGDLVVVVHTPCRAVVISWCVTAVCQRSSYGNSTGKFNLLYGNNWLY